jgi:hypothetical protein
MTLSDDEYQALSDEYHDATLAAIVECKRLGYPPTRWELMVRQEGAVAAARRVLQPGRPNDGFVRLAYLMNPRHPELTVEWSALESRWRPLFTDEMRAVARQRLDEVPE